MSISAKGLEHRQLGELINAQGGDVTVDDCCGQRFIASGKKSGTITINGTPGNALGAYMDGASVFVNGNGQDAVGDTMNDGQIIINGSAGDALGYSMRGGKIYVRGDAGYRTGIHMKEYKDKRPVIVVGGKTGSFLGEYLAGGMIAVLGIDCEDIPVGAFTGTGMHGGKIFLRTDKPLVGLPDQVLLEEAQPADMQEIEPFIRGFAELFGHNADELLDSKYQILKPNAKNPYKQLYTPN